MSNLLKILKASQRMKIKNNWSREMGSSFIASEIKSIKLIDGKIEIKCEDHVFFGQAKDLNLPETEECIKALSTIKCDVCGKYIPHLDVQESSSKAICRDCFWLMDQKIQS